MPQTTVEVHRDKQDKHPITVNYDFGADLTEAQALFDGPSPLDRVTFHCYLSGAKAQLQEFVRKCLARVKVVETPPPAGAKKGTKPTRKTVPDPMTQDEIAAAVANWKPTIKRRGASSIAKAKKVIGNMSVEERTELLRQLQEADGAAADAGNAADAKEAA